ncbi:MAG: lysylphosphatidylglycerol synthase domain-containing protein [Rhodospirillales bacterium]
MIKHLILSFCLMLVVVVVLLSIQRLAGLDTDLVVFRWPFLAAAVASHCLTLALMAARLTAATGAGMRGFAGLFDMTVLHNFLLAFLPARMADVYYPFLVADRLESRLAAGVGNLVLLRLLDVAAISLIVVVTLPWAAADGLQSGSTALLLAAALGLAVVGVIWLEQGLAWAAVPIRGGARRQRGRRQRRIFVILVQARGWVRGRSTGCRLMLAAVSVAAWLSSAMTYFLIFRGLGLNLDPAQAVLAAQLTELAGALPVQTVAGIGAGEGVLAGFLVLFGSGMASAVVLAVWCRLAILGAIGALFMARALLIIGRGQTSGRGPITGQTLMKRLFGPVEALRGTATGSNA